jgi:serine phosphatase RsbU (regulator of sigma subunit)/anti-sigma regulatory factor (Ser/Thr protein kinase)
MSVEKQTTMAVAARGGHRTSLRIEVACELSAVRAGVAQVRGWLAEKGLPEAELGAWELALVEAANNAVKYAEPKARQLPVVIEVSAGEQDIEVTVADRTAGFDWPAEIKLPEADAERGRGLYLMKSLTDEIFYLRHPGRNVLVLRRARPAGGNFFPDLAGLQRRLAEAETALTDMTSELAASYESLVAVFRYSSELGAHTDLKEFSNRLLRDLMQIAEADGAVLRLVSADGKKLEPLLLLPEREKLTLAPVTLQDEFLKSAESRAARTRQDIWFSPEEPLGKDDPLRAAMPVGNGVCHAFFVADQLVGTATLGRLAANRPFTAAQVNLLHTFVDFLAIQIVNARLLDERTATRVTRRELEIAAEIQRSLLPARLPACPPFALAAACQNALQVGGDFYDAIPAGDGAVLLVIADVMGKGVPAALFAAVLRTTIRSMRHLFSQPGELLGAVNRILFPDLSRVDMFITAKLVYLDPRRAELISASAGHCPLLVWQPGTTETSVASRSGLPLGIEPDANYPQNASPLPPGAAALLYTDGLSESRDAGGELLGEKNLQKIFAEAAAQTRDVESGKLFLLERLTAYRGGVALSDDQTFILIRHPT